LNHKKSARRTHYFHTLSKHIVQRCVDEEVGTIVVGDLFGIREGEEISESKDWGAHGNLDLHSWAFDRFTDLLEYKAEMEGITVEPVSERDTSKSCSCCGRERKANRVERGLYVCDECGTVANADVNGAENIRQKVSPSSPNLSVNRSNGWLAQPSTFLFDKGNWCVCTSRTGNVVNHNIPTQRCGAVGILALQRGRMSTSQSAHNSPI